MEFCFLVFEMYVIEEIVFLVELVFKLYFYIVYFFVVEVIFIFCNVCKEGVNIMVEICFYYFGFVVDDIEDGDICYKCCFFIWL